MDTATNILSTNTVTNILSTMDCYPIGNGIIAAYVQDDGLQNEVIAAPWLGGDFGLLGCVDDGFLVVDGTTRLAYLFQKHGVLHWSYVQEKFNVSERRARVLTLLIGKTTGRDTYIGKEERNG